MGVREAGIANAESREDNFVLSGELVRRGPFDRVGFEVRQFICGFLVFPILKNVIKYAI